MRMNNCMSIFGATAGAFLLLLLVSSESALSIGVCRKATCPCSPEQEKQGMKTIGGQCLDCARNAKELARLEAETLELRKKLIVLDEQIKEDSEKLEKSWKSVQDELPRFRDLSGSYLDLLKRIKGAGDALNDSGAHSGPARLDENLEGAYRDVSRLAKLTDPFGTIVPDLFRDVSDSVLYERRLDEAEYQDMRMWEALPGMEDDVAEMRALQEKCSGKGKKKSELELRQEPRVYASRQPAFLWLVASRRSSARSATTPCGGSRENLEKCAEAERAMRNIANFDLPQTKFAVGEALRILEPFGQGNANKMTDQEVRQRAKQAAGALNKLAEPLDHMVSNSSKVLTLLQRGGT